MPDQLGETLDELAAEAGDVQSSKAHGGIEFVRGGRVFASVEGEAVELRLMADVAEAARRTPDTHPSARGDEWVRFFPSDWDDYARDRLDAWFRVAWRFAAEGKH